MKELKIELFKYLVYPPCKRLCFASENNLSNRVQEIADCYDMFEYHYVRYCLGWTKTLHRVFYELRRSKELELFESEHILTMANYIRDVLLEAEIYEVMHNVDASIKKIEKLLNQ